VTDADGRVIQYSYDAANRETGEVWKSNAGATLNIVTYAYDNSGNRTSAADYNGTVTYRLDALNRVQGYTNVFGQVLTYTYNGYDQVTLRTDSLGGTLTSVYDTADRLTSRQFSGTGATGTVVRVDFGYSSRNEQTSITWFSALGGTGTVAYSAYAYDDAGRLTGITNRDSTSATLSYYNYSYDNADRVSTQTHWSQVASVVYSGTNTYVYDATNQLLNDSVATYSYDANGNRTMAGYATGTNNQMTNDGTYTYTYDAAGNTIQKSRGSGLETWYYGWDNENRLTSVRETSDGTTNELTVTYTYDVEGHLVEQDKWKTGGSAATTRFAYDGDNVWADLDGSNNLLVRYLFGDKTDQILTRTVASGTNVGVALYQTDNLGSVRDLSSWSGQVQDHLDFTGFGVVTESNPGNGDRYKFTGREYDADTGLENNRARWYQASNGRWLSEDPVGFGGADPNLTRYVGNSPTYATDSTGLWKIVRNAAKDRVPATAEKGDTIKGLGRF
jgi:RHS repeat-associated protein